MVCIDDGVVVVASPSKETEDLSVYRLLDPFDRMYNSLKLIVLK